MVTLTDEVGRQQVLYHDVLGRLLKTEILQTVDNVTSAYATTVNTYNVRDQVRLVQQYQGGDDQTNVVQNTVIGFDGYGRMNTQHFPQQQIDPSDSSTTDHTTWEYNPDDTVKNVKDARGARTNYTYNSRHLVLHITYDPPASGVLGAPDVSFEYDAAGNRKKMTDGTGRTDYVYDSLSRMTSETHVITGVGSYPIGYGYNVGGELTSISDPFGQSVSYGYDGTGRLGNVGATGFPNVSQFASNVHYRAWGGIKDMTYGNGKTLSVGYNARLAPATYQIPSVLNKTYQYFDDGSLKSASDLLDNRYDRAMQYDPIGRLAVAKTGSEARGGATPDGPFNQTYQYDAFGHTIARTSRQWTSTFGDSGTYQDERHNGWSYDADGNVTNNTDVQFTYNAAGLPAQTVNVLGGSISANAFDGDRQRIKNAFQLNSSSAATPRYYLRSTALGGQVVAEILSSGEKVQGYVYAGNELMAVQKLPVVGDGASYTVWRHAEPSGSVRGSDEGGGQNWTAELNSAELDATGVNYGKEDTGSDPLNTLKDENNPDFHAMGNPSRLSGGCMFNGMPIADCGFLMKSSSFDKFNLVAGAVTASTRIVRTRTVTTLWHIQLGASPMDDVNGDKVIVNTNDFSWSTEKTIPIYDSTSFLSVSAFLQQNTPISGLEQKKKNTGPALNPAPTDDKEIRRRMAEGQAWDRWQAWVNCNTPIMNKYNSKLREYQKIGGEAFSSWFGRGVLGNAVIIFADPNPGGVVVATLNLTDIYYSDKRAMDKIESDYRKEVQRECGAKPPHP
jgi:YD repeat-containing protein